MKLLALLTFILLLLGCSGEQISHNITKTQIAMSGNKAPAFFNISNIETMRDYVFDTKDFSFKFPTAKENDFSKMNGWKGGSSRNNKTITVYLDPIYHISVATSGNVLKYEERERAIESNDINYLRTRMPKRVKKNGEIMNISLRTILAGKENYPCTVRTSSHLKYGKNKISYGCFKFNENRTKVKYVALSVTYTHYKSPNEYTYKDLQNRAKRTLDSLYIKDGW